ncbi:MAG: aldehyde dehydrogenase family protein, partial [Psychrobacter celer]
MLQKIRDMLMQVLPICPVMLDLAAPTIYTEVPATSRLWTEEVFGPVLVSATFADNAQAIALANDSKYALAASIVSADEHAALEMVRHIRAGH